MFYTLPGDRQEAASSRQSVPGQRQPHPPTHRRQGLQAHVSHAHTCTHVHTLTCTFIHAHTHVHTLIHTRSHAHTHVHALTHTYAFTRSHTHTHSHTYTGSHAHTHTHAQTRSHAAVQNLPQSHKGQKMNSVSSARPSLEIASMHQACRPVLPRPELRGYNEQRNFLMTADCWEVI